MNEKRPAKKGMVKRILKTLLEFYPVMMPLTIVCILFNAVVSSIPSIFMQRIISAVETSWQDGNWDSEIGRAHV